MPVSRRRFVQISSLATMSMMVPKFLKAFEQPALAGAGPGKVLVVVQLSGGNDGLNTIIPVRNDIYYQSRPLLGIKREDTLALTDDVGLNPSFKGVKSLYDQGYVSILNNVGYPEPNRSHFRSMDIWQTGSRSDELLTTGWLGRYLDETCDDCNTHNTRAVELDDSLSLSMKGKERKALAVRDVDQFYKASRDPYFSELNTAHAREHEAQLASYLYKTLGETISSAAYIKQQTKLYTTAQTYPNTAIGNRMKTVAQLINSGANTRVYYVSHGSFDTHVNQRGQQERLFGQLDEALTAFVSDLQAADRFNDVMVMSFSEFGRRVGQNASQGTDHGTASNMFVIGGGLKKAGLYNEMPDLTNLDQGDLKYSIDFKQVYATVLDKWLGIAPQKILGKKYEQLSFV